MCEALIAIAALKSTGYTLFSRGALNIVLAPNVQAVFLFERFVEPRHVFLQFRHDLFDTPLVCGFVVEIELRPRKERHADAVGIRFRQNRLSGFRIVPPADRTVFFLLVVKVIDVLARIEIAVRIHEKKRRKNRFELIDDALSAFGI